MAAHGFVKLRRISFFLAMLLLCQPAWAANRVALVIGNSAYKNAAPLSNPINDAVIVEATLKNAGFDVVQTRLDIQAAEMRRALRDFADQARDADVAVVYYAGHGIEIEGTNYLIPIDATLERDTDVYDEAFSLDRVLLAVEPARQLRLVILDACRNNPFSEKMKRTVGSRAISRGLARIEPATANTLVAFAAKAGSTASDGNSKNSPYAAALVKYIGTPGLDLRRVFGFVRDDVMKATGNRQEPYVYGTLGGDDVPLVPAKEPAKEAAKETAKEAASAATPRSEMRHDYELALQVGNKDALNFFIAQYPDSYYANLAKLQLAKIDAEEKRAAADEKARQAEQEQARLVNQGAQQTQLAKAASELKAAQEARAAAEAAKEAAQQQAAQAEQRRVAAEIAAAVAKNTAPVAPSASNRPGEPNTNADAKVAALPSPQAPAPPAAPPELAKSLQTELRRVGCFTGSANGEWDAASRRSLELFNQNAGTKFDAKAASADALDAIKLKAARVCPLICGSGLKRDGDRCVKITCAAGYFVNDNDECERRKARQAPSARLERRSRDREEAPARPAKPKAEASADNKGGGGMPFMPFFLP
ncbi:MULTISPECIES: caspase family protein [unclassified Bradyrhizobium]|uniref:caspase family protein n=1 Tax=unclassified Bradyrhizobium TaxID=2631580 RepID=UPI00247AB23B|nr:MULTISPECIES: caspase family protein [unclassified Bradyrhizobium]WGR71857.1 caspase family protein [Bradyrhizobium sp. ISRA426]WGR76692.1 caspase family protein [Bradyrhizobium sp. ISRA430]WGR87097.1 caspase family protein [Bradyrhizobium sp. ISRA432]